MVETFTWVLAHSTDLEKAGEAVGKGVTAVALLRMAGAF